MAGNNRIQMYHMVVFSVVNLLIANQATEARFKSICAQTAYPTLCHSIVKGPNPRQATRNTIRHLEARTRLAIADAARHKNGNQAITICYSTLTDAAYNLGKAKKSIRRKTTLKKFLTAVVSDYGVCVNGFMESHQINTLQNAVDELRKMGTNCLLLATLIK